MLWEIAAADEAALDRYESVAKGLSLKRVVDVDADSGVLPALIYVATNNDHGSPRKGYLDIILKGAIEERPVRRTHTDTPGLESLTAGSSATLELWTRQSHLNGLSHLKLLKHRWSTRVNAALFKSVTVKS